MVPGGYVRGSDGAMLAAPSATCEAQEQAACLSGAVGRRGAEAQNEKARHMAASSPSARSAARWASRQDGTCNPGRGKYLHYFDEG